MDFKLCIVVLLSTSFQGSDCLHYYKTPALDNQFSNFEITTSIPSDGSNGSQSIQEALIFAKYNRQYITFNFKGKGHAQLQFLYPLRVYHFKVEIGGGTRHNEISIYDEEDFKKNSITLTDITSEHEYRPFYIQFKWNYPYGGYRVLFGLGSDPRTNHVLYADFCRPMMRRQVNHISISTASDFMGEWQFATAGQMFGGCDNDTVCSKNSLNLQCQSDDESKATGLIGTCTPELDDFSTVPFGDGIFRKSAQHATESFLHATPMRSGCLVATIDRTLPSLLVWYFVSLLHGYY